MLTETERKIVIENLKNGGSARRIKNAVAFVEILGECDIDIDLGYVLKIFDSVGTEIDQLIASEL